MTTVIGSLKLARGFFAAHSSIGFSSRNRAATSRSRSKRL